MIIDLKISPPTYLLHLGFNVPKHKLLHFYKVSKSNFKTHQYQIQNIHFQS